MSLPDNSYTLLLLFGALTLVAVVVVVVVARRDTPRRRQAEEQVRKLSRAVEQTDSLIIITDAQGIIEYVNPSFTQVTGYTPDEAVGQNPRILNSGHSSAEVYDELWRSISSGGTWKGEFHNKKKDGQLYWAAATVSPIKNEAGEITHFVGIQEDITARKQADETIRLYAEELEQRNTDLDAFSYTIAHDLKSPLSLLIGRTSLLSDSDGGKLSKSGRDDLVAIQEITFKMVGMVESLLLLARLRDARQVLARVEMGPVVQGALDRLALRIQQRPVAVSVMDDLPPAMGHAPWLEEVFANLLTNAVNYIGRDNPNPQISVRGRRDGDRVRYEVEDNGIGISRRNQQMIFRAFSRVNPAEAGGTGLGLSIVERIVSKLGGEVGVESEPGKGSTFWFTLPAPPDSNPTG